MHPEYAAFSKSEHRDRLDRAREILRANDIDVCISVAPEHLYYFGGYEFMGERQQSTGAHLRRQRW